MRLLFLLPLIALVACNSSTTPAKHEAKTRNGHFPSYNQCYTPPAGLQSFELSQDYPDTFNVSESYPWQRIDFKTDYAGYMKAVLRYCLEGNTDVDFKVQDNAVRKWYHAPWLHAGLNGREYIHGLTRERPVPPKEMHWRQTGGLENWAVGFYNPPGGYTIGKVWLSGAAPEPSMASFPEGTVSFKLLFTAGTPDQVPFLKGTKEWPANIYNFNPEGHAPPPPGEVDSCGFYKGMYKRHDSTVRLLQIDVAVRDKRAGGTGWVFGTFIYDAMQKGATVWDRMVPVGLMWGDDGKTTALMNKEAPSSTPR